MTDDVDTTNSDTTSPVPWRSCGVEKISHDLNSATSKEQLKEIGAAIIGVALYLVVPPSTDPIPDIEEYSTKKMEILNSNNNTIELDKKVGLEVVLIPILGSSETGLAFESFSSHTITEGQEINLAQSLFSLGSYTTKPSGGTKIRDLSGTIQKKKKHARKVEGKENFMQESKGGEHRVDVVQDMVEVINNKDGGCGKETKNRRRGLGDQ